MRLLYDSTPAEFRSAYRIAESVERLSAAPKYRLLSPGDKDDFLKGLCRHRLSVTWKATAHLLSDAISADEIRKEFSIYHPISTSVSMDQIRGQQLLDKLSAKFGSAAAA
jgi:hypothetical protein